MTPFDTLRVAAGAAALSPLPSPGFVAVFILLSLGILVQQSFYDSKTGWGIQMMALGGFFIVKVGFPLYYLHKFVENRFLSKRKAGSVV